MRRMLDREFRDVNYGRAIVLSVGSSATVVQTEGCNEGSELVTVGFSARPTKKLPIVGFRFRATATVLFGVGGGSVTFRCDYTHGTQITVPATALRIEATYSSDGAPAESVPVAFAAFLAYGTRPATAGLMPRLTVGAEALAAGVEGTIVEIPAWASGMGAWSSIGVGSAEVRFYAGDAATLIATAKINGAAEQAPIPADAMFASVKNVSSVGAGDFEAYFGLAV